MTPAAVAVIRPAALRHNLARVRSAAPGCRVLAVVKADAYGHGLVEIARAFAEADGLAVARLEEALQLRGAGIDGRIAVLGGFVGAAEAAAAIANGLDLVVHSLEQVAVLESLSPAPVDCWIKVDTGMGRLGLHPEVVGEVRDRLDRWCSGRGVLRLMTHFAAADDPGDPATTAQLSVFEAVVGGWRGDVSLANSAAILQWPASTRRPSGGGQNWVRPGLMLYGASPVPGSSGEDFGLRPAMSFETRVIALRRLPRGRRVGYGGTWQAGRDSLVGVAAAGYADGYPWAASGAANVWVRGRRVPVVGRVSMDMISIDLTDLPEVALGDRVLLWGDELRVEEVARLAGTIPYELLTGVSPRVRRMLDA